MRSEIDKVRDGYRFTNLAGIKDEVVRELTSIINKHSLESDSNTPDFIIAAYLYDCLMNWNLTVGQRIYWYNPEGKKS